MASANSTRARYEVLTLATAHTPTQLAAHWLAELDTACTAATPSFAAATGAYAKWEGMPTHANLLTANVFDSQGEHKMWDEITPVPSDNFVHIEVCAGNDTDTTATVAAGASTITNVASTITEPLSDVELSMTLADASLYSDLVGHLPTATNPIYIKFEVSGEIVKCTNFTGEVATIVRGQCGTVAAASLDNAVTHFTLGLDDTSVPVVALPQLAAEVPYTIIIGTEQMRVTASAALILTVTRGYDGTTAAVHADGAAVTQYLDEATPSFDVSNGALLVDECYYKIVVPSTITEPIVSTTATSMTLADASIFSDIAGTPTPANPIYLEFAVGGEIVGVTGIAGEVATITRGQFGTTAATHLDNAVISWFGTEVMKVKSIAANLVHFTRGCHGTTAVVIPTGAAIYRLWGPEIYDAALTAVNTIADGTFQEGHYGTPNFMLGYHGAARWSTETQTETA